MKTQIKNKTCYYFDDLIKIDDWDLDKAVVSVFKDGVYFTSYKNFYGLKRMQIIFDNVNKIINKDR